MFVSKFTRLKTCMQQRRRKILRTLAKETHANYKHRHYLTHLEPRPRCPYAGVDFDIDVFELYGGNNEQLKKR